MAKVKQGYSASIEMEKQRVDISGAVLPIEQGKLCVITICGSGDIVSMIVTADEMIDLGQTIVTMGRMFDKYVGQR